MICWSDECSVERGRGGEQEWAFRTPYQKWDREMVQTYDCVRLLLLFATWPLGHLPPLLTYTAYDYFMSHSLLLTNTV
jgi:hypothetical protein